jgi:hypothetical protein
MYGRIETNKLDFRSVITANEAIVIPIANDPVLPTKILPRMFKAARASQSNKGPSIKIKDDCDKANRPIRIIAGQAVSKPFSPPNWFTVLVTIMTIKGIIMK